MRLASLVLALPFVMGLGCGSDGGGGADDDGDDDDIVLVPDAGPPDGPSIDANSCPGPGNTDICNDDCVDFDTDENNCGSCDGPCNGGEACNSGECACPGAIVPAAPTFGESTVQHVSQINLDIGAADFPDPTNAAVSNGLLVTKSPDDTETGIEHDITTTIFLPPMMAAIYNGSLTTQNFDSAFVAVDGKIVFDDICPESFAGHATNVTFRGAHIDLTTGTVTPDPAGCTFTVGRVDFTFGPGCATPAP